MFLGSLNPKIKFLGQKVCSVAREHTDRRTDRQIHTKVTTVGTLSGVQDLFLQPIIKDRLNNQGILCWDIGPILDDRLKEKLLKP